MKESSGNMFNPEFSKTLQGQKHHRRWAITVPVSYGSRCISTNEEDRKQGTYRRYKKYFNRQWQWQWTSFIAMHYIKNIAFIHIVIHHYWYNWRYSTSESYAWQKGLEAMAYVPQYLLYNVISKGDRKIKSTVHVLLFDIHSCLVTNKQFCVNNFFMEWNRFLCTHIHIISP